MGITYKEFAWLLNKNMICHKVYGGVIGCPGNIVDGEITSNICRVHGKEQCTKCWNREIQCEVIAEIIGDVNIVGICPSQLTNGREFTLQECHIDTEYPILLYENGEFFAAKKEGFKFYMKEKFTKSDLKDGMMVVERNGYGYIWLYGAKRDDCECFHDTRNDLTSIRGRKHDIIKVGYPKVDSYDLTGVERILCSVNSGFRQIIWEREEKEISSEEAFAILKQHYGCDVKIKEK